MNALFPPYVAHRRVAYVHKGKDGVRDEYTVYTPFRAYGPYPDARTAETCRRYVADELAQRFAALKAAGHALTD